MFRILFVCTGNQYRSPLAAAYFRAVLQRTGQLNEYSVGSAGTWVVPGLTASPVLKKIARLHDIEIEDHTTNEVELNLLMNQDLVLVMEQGHREALKTEFPSVADRIFLLSEVVNEHEYDIPDPAKDMKNIDQIAGDLIMLIEQGAKEICQLVKYLKHRKT